MYNFSLSFLDLSNCCFYARKIVSNFIASLIYGFLMTYLVRKTWPNVCICWIRVSSIVFGFAFTEGRSLWNWFFRSLCKSFGLEGNIFPVYVSLDPCFPSVVTRTSRFSLRGKALEAERSRSDQWSQYSRNPWRKIIFIWPFFRIVPWFLLFSATFSISIILIRRLCFSNAVMHFNADFFVLQHCTSKHISKGYW